VRVGFQHIGSLLILSSVLAGCSTVTPIPCTGFGDPNLADDEIAILQLSTASLEAIDGNRVPLGRDPETFVCSEARLYPGMHTLTLRAELAVSEPVDPTDSTELGDTTGYIELKNDLSFRAEPGHAYELHFERDDSQDFGVTWWIIDMATNEVVAGMSVE
jgi:hypothetical protein